MKTQWFATSLMVLTGLTSAACKDDNSPVFLPLPDVCEERARALCEALRNCCSEGTTPLNCEQTFTNLCESERPQVEAETAGYHSPTASRRLAEDEQAWKQCGATVRPLSSYFEGGRELGASCETDTHCASGFCSEGACAESPLVVSDYCLQSQE